jgi:hypothetical protein
VSSPSRTMLRDKTHKDYVSHFIFTMPSSRAFSSARFQFGERMHELFIRDFMESVLKPNCAHRGQSENN